MTRQIARNVMGMSRAVVALTIAAIALAACEDERLLPGERFGPRELDAAGAAIEERDIEAAAGRPDLAPAPLPPRRIPTAPYAVVGESPPVGLPSARRNAEWTHPYGGPDHRITHPALGGSLRRIWSAPIGEGNGRRVRLTADPVVAAGRVFTMDSAGEVRAFTLGGGELWRRPLIPAGERPGDAPGGGLAVDGGRLFATTGFGALHALDPTSGALLWSQRLGAPPAAAPTADDGLVYVTSRDGQAWAVDAGDGRVVWQLRAGEGGAVTSAGAAPAIAGRAVILPFGSGEVVAALRRGGVRLWSATVTGERAGQAFASISDISSDPVVVGGTIYAGNPSGRIVALDVASGERLWTAADGAWGAVWPEGDSIFLVSDQNELLRLDRDTGERVWAATLPLFRDARTARRAAVFAHYGPVLAGGRLIVASNDGVLRQIDPASGALLRLDDLPGPAARNPVVAQETLFIVTADGRLHAYR